MTEKLGRTQVVKVAPAATGHAAVVELLGQDVHVEFIKL